MIKQEELKYLFITKMGRFIGATIQAQLQKLGQKLDACIKQGMSTFQ